MPVRDAAPLTDEVAVDPATGRPAGRAQAPVLPCIQDAFAGTSGVETLTPVVLTAPALVIGLTARVAGRIVDRVGRERLLVGALLADYSSGPRRERCSGLQVVFTTVAACCSSPSAARPGRTRGGRRSGSPPSACRWPSRRRGSSGSPPRPPARRGGPRCPGPGWPRRSGSPCSAGWCFTSWSSSCRSSSTRSA
ncbi:hypothetical protein GCM10027261_25810 [Geodermatophilus arenarius]